MIVNINGPPPARKPVCFQDYGSGSLADTRFGEHGQGAQEAENAAFTV